MNSSLAISLLLNMKELRKNVFFADWAQSPFVGEIDFKVQRVFQLALNFFVKVDEFKSGIFFDGRVADPAKNVEVVAGLFFAARERAENTDDNKTLGFVCFFKCFDRFQNFLFHAIPSG